MIRFRCKNCGRSIQAPDEFAGRKGKCPKCKKPITVPKSNELKAINNSSQTLADKSNAEIAKELLGAKHSVESEQAAEQRRHSFFVPHYDEATLFVMSITFILLYLASKTMRTDLHRLIFRDFDIRIIICFILFAAGMVFSIFHAFSERRKNVAEKAAMLLFAIFVSAGTGIYAGVYMFKYARGWLMIFPIWNVIYGCLLLIMLRFHIVTVHCISDRNATRSQIILGLSAAIIILLCCQFFFNLHWAITYSICIAYTTSLDKGVQSVFGQR